MSCKNYHWDEGGAGVRDSRCQRRGNIRKELGPFLRSTCIPRKSVNKCGQVGGEVGGQNRNSLVSELEVIMLVKIINRPEFIYQ